MKPISFLLLLYWLALGSFDVVLTQAQVPSEVGPMAPAAQALRAKKFSEAHHLFDQILSIYPMNARALRGRAISNYQLGWYEKALADCDKALSIEPKNCDVLRLKYSVLLHLNRFDAAQKTCTALIDAGYPDKAQAYEMRAQADQYDDNYAQAVIDASDSVILNGNRWYALLIRAHALGLLGFEDAAMGDMNRVMQLNPKLQSAEDEQPSLEDIRKAQQRPIVRDFKAFPREAFEDEF